MAFPPKKAAEKSKGPKGPHTPIKEYPGQTPPVAPKGKGAASPDPMAGSAPKAPAASKSTNAQGPQPAASEPKLSPEAEAARASQGAIKITTATGPAVAPPPDPRASYQVGEAEDNTPIFSFTTLASAAQQKGKPSAVLPPSANSDLKSTTPEDSADEDDTSDVEEPEDETEAPAKKPAAKKPPFGK
jgi:hypothetical protein